MREEPVSNNHRLLREVFQMHGTICRKILSPVVLALLLAGTLAFTPHPASAAQKFLLATVGTKQGSIKGTSTVKGHEGWLEIESVDVDGLALSEENDAALRRDTASGLPSGKRQHRTVTIVREVDSASPVLWSALNTNEVFKSITVECANGQHIRRLTVTGGTVSIKREGTNKEIVTIVGGNVTYN
jgi:type VI protein secretion system component Hcp